MTKPSFKEHSCSYVIANYTDLWIKENSDLNKYPTTMAILGTTEDFHQTNITTKGVDLACEFNVF